MKLPCEIVQDLLPLYHDGVCSEASRAQVKEHLEDCETCRKMLESIDAEIEVPKQEVQKAEPLVSIQVRWNREKRKLLGKCIMAGILAFALFIGCWWGLTQWCVVPLKGSDFTVLTRCVLSDGCVFVEYTWDYGNCALNASRTDKDSGSVYDTRLRPILGRRDTGTGYPYAPKYGLYFFPEEQKMLDSEGNLIPVQELYLGTEEDALLLWSRDMELPAASDRVEAEYQQLLDAYDAPNAPVKAAVIAVEHGTVPDDGEELGRAVQETMVCGSESD